MVTQKQIQQSAANSQSVKDKNKHRYLNVLGIQYETEFFPQSSAVVLLSGVLG